MKIGIISNCARTGKTSVMLALGYTYSRSQQKKVAMFSTGSLRHIIDPLMSLQDKDEAASTGVFKAMLESRSISGEKLFDYAVRGGRDEVYIFDLFSGFIDAQKTMDFLTSTAKTINTDMTLIEISKDLNYIGNKETLEACDVVLNVFTCDVTSIASMKKYMEGLSPKDQKKTVLVCNSYDPRIMSEKKLSGFTKKGQNEVLILQRNPSFVRMEMDGDMSGFTDKCVNGHEEFTLFRSQLTKIMQALYDTPKRKRIIPVENWKRGV